MLIGERLQKIVQLVNEQGSVRVSELSRMFGVTEETIRRDLDRLENEGKLVRSHGGAISVGETQADIPYIERETLNPVQKRQIAQEAIRHIRKGERIVLDASTTAWYMARLMPDMWLTVVTNSLQVALELAGKEKVEVISAGGQLARRSLSYVGPLTERSLSGYHVDKAFLSCKGIHPEGGVSESNELQAIVKRKMIDIADEVYLLADYSKFGVRAFTTVADFDKIDRIVTDDGTDRETIRRLTDLGVKVLVAGQPQPAP